MSVDIETVRRHCPFCGEEVDQPADTLASLAAAPDFIAEAVRASTAGADGWSASEIAAHLSDVEVGFGWRIRTIIASDNPTLQPFDQEAWATALDYPNRDRDTSLEAFRASRAANVELLRSLPDAGWSRPFSHPEYGDLELVDLVRHMSDHDLEHLRQIRGQTPAGQR